MSAPRRSWQDLAIAFAFGFLAAASLLALAIPQDAWDMAWRFRGPAG